MEDAGTKKQQEARAGDMAVAWEVDNAGMAKGTIVVADSGVLEVDHDIVVDHMDHMGGAEAEGSGSRAASVLDGLAHPEAYEDLPNDSSSF